jgi:apolipoprotein N-acyltransferase
MTAAAAGRIAVIAGSVAASGAAFHHGTALVPVPWLVWLAPLPVLLLAPRIVAAAAAGVAFAAYVLGAAHMWSYFTRSLEMPPVPAALVIGGGAVVLTIATLLFRSLVARGRTTLAALAFPAAWVGAEYLAGLVSGSGAAATLAVAQSDVPAVLRIASATGVWGIDFLVFLVPAIVGAVLAPGQTRRSRVQAGFVGFALVAVGLGYGLVQGGSAAGPTVRVTLLVANPNHYATDVDSPAGRDLAARYVERIRALPAGTRVVVLPETGFAATDATLPALVDPIRRLAAERHLDVVVGVLLRSRSDRGAVRANAAVAVPAGGGAPLVYRKQHLVAGPEADEMRAGHELVFLPGQPIGIAICADMNFPAMARDYAREGARLLVAPASDQDVDAWQHSRIAIARGVENGMSVAWAARKGALVLADPNGRVQAEARTGEASPFAIATADLPLAARPTVYTRGGDWFAGLCLLLVAVALARTGR